MRSCACASMSSSPETAWDYGLLRAGVWSETAILDGARPSSDGATG